jgi:hypothetical protein
VRPLIVEVDGKSWSLSSGEELTFGRDRSCTICLDPEDLGVSRVAGRISTRGEAWVVTNLSGKRALHIADAIGFAVPLPVAAAGCSPSRRVVDQPQLIVLVPGEQWTYALALRTELDAATTACPVAPLNPHTTRTQVPQLTDNRREVLVAMIRGYLRPYPYYDPRPATYQQVADLLGLTKSQVTRRLEQVREGLIAAGVQFLDGETDARRALCEWLLATRTLTPEDLPWLQTRIDAARKASPAPAAAPEQPKKGASDSSAAAPDNPVHPDSSTTEFSRLPHVRVIIASQRAALALATPLARRLEVRYGENWLTAVNDTRKARGFMAGRSLEDHRFCLAVFAHDKATRNWASCDIRDAARQLHKLATDAHHDHPLSGGAVQEANNLADRLKQWGRRHG